MPGTYNVRKNQAAFQRTITQNDKRRAEIQKKQSEDLADRSERVASYLKALADNKTVDIKDYIPR